MQEKETANNKVLENVGAIILPFIKKAVPQ